ncbi:MAG: nucleotidyltransferase [Lachnospiraceae bacterium]
MKVIGIVAEYNPFHNGHAYQIEQVRKQFQADYVITVMSGDFVQRGAPAIVDKYTRANMALQGGIDAVLELPGIWAVSSAEFFANGAIKALDALGIVDGVCFGCETPNLDGLQEIAEILEEEPEKFQQVLRERLQEGDTYPAARFTAVQSCVPDEKQPLVKELLSSPNNILALEYLKAIRRTKSRLIPYPIQREGQAYHDAGQKSDQANQNFASASAIRNCVFRQETAQIRSKMPSASADIFLEKIQQNLYLQENDFSAAIAYRLLQDSEYEKLADVTSNLANRMRKLLPEYQNCTDFCQRLKTREITYTRVSRVLFHALLGQTKEVYAKAKSLNDVPYLRLLGIRKTAMPLLSQMKKKASVPILCRQKEVSDCLQADAGSILQTDLFASALYRTTLMQKQQVEIPPENKRALLIV